MKAPAPPVIMKRFLDEKERIGTGQPQFHADTSITV
jgi:hypothetical protein